MSTTRKSPQQRAALRCCASCHWIYPGPGDCPKCGFASYGARYVYGDRAYRYRFNQTPWLERKMAATHREKAAISSDPKWRNNMAAGAMKDYARCFQNWRRLNPAAPRDQFPT